MSYKTEKARKVICQYDDPSKSIEGQQPYFVHGHWMVNSIGSISKKTKKLDDRNQLLYSAHENSIPPTGHTANHRFNIDPILSMKYLPPAIHGLSAHLLL